MLVARWTGVNNGAQWPQIKGVPYRSVAIFSPRPSLLSPVARFVDTLTPAYRPGSSHGIFNEAPVYSFLALFSTVVRCGHCLWDFVPHSRWKSEAALHWLALHHLNIYC